MSASASSASKRPTFIIIEDSREQHPLDFAPFAPFGVTVERTRLRMGDYTVKGFERSLFIERKSLTDCVTTLTHGRKRFIRETFDRASFASSRHLIVEASLAELSRPYQFAPGANPESIVNSLYALMMPPTDVHVFCSPSRALIAWHVFKVCAMFVHRATHGTQGVYNAIFAADAADLAPFADVPKDIGSNLSHPRVDELKGSIA